MDAPITDFFILSHGPEKRGRWIRGQLIRKTGLLHKVSDARRDARTRQAELHG